MNTCICVRGVVLAGKRVSKLFDIKLRVEQGCTLFLKLFNIL